MGFSSVVDAWASWNIHLFVVLKYNAAILICILEYDATIFEHGSWVFAGVGWKPDIAAFVFPLGIDVVELVDFGVLILWEGHVLFELLNGVRVFEPWLVVSYDVRVVQFREQCHLLQHFPIVEVVVVYHCLLYRVYVAIQLVPHLVHLPETALSDQLQLLKLGLVSSTSVWLLHLHRLVALLDFHCRTVGLLDHIVKVENLIQNLAVYLLFSLYLFRSSVSHFEVEVRIDLSVGADQQRWAYLLWILFLLDFVETNHHVLKNGGSEVENVKVVLALVEFSHIIL